MTNEQKLDHLSQRWLTAKKYEDVAKAERIEIEEEIASLIDEPDNGEGTSNEETPNFKIKAGYGITRTVLQDKVDECFDSNEGDNVLMSLIFPTQHKLDLKQLRAVEAVNPDLYNKACIAISAKPRKTSIKVEPITN